MRRWAKALAVAAGLGLAVPVLAASTDDAKDTATEKKAEAKKKVRSAKPSKSAQDRADDTKDTAASSTAKAKKSARATGRKAKKEVNDATR